MIRTKTVIAEEDAAMYAILDILIAMSEQMDKKDLLERLVKRDEELDDCIGGEYVQDVLSHMINHLCKGL